MELYLWLGFLGIVFVMLALDLGVFNRKAHVMGIRESLAWTAVWIFMALLFNVGVGMVLSALFVFFRDIDYLWSVLVQLTMYGSAVFYTIDRFPPALQLAFSFNPVYRHIAYIREIVLAGSVPSLESHLTLLGFSVAAFLAGSFMYKHYNTKFLYYV